MLQVQGYTVVEKLQADGCSVVYRGVRDADGLAVVFKVDGEAAARNPGSRMIREFEILRRLNAPGLVRAVELTRSEGRDVLVLERARGVPLSTYLRTHGRLRDARGFLALAIPLVESLAT